jgi:hypothetical protein
LPAELETLAKALAAITEARFAELFEANFPATDDYAVTKDQRDAKREELFHDLKNLRAYVAAAAARGDALLKCYS